jgi:hypothetical protein
MVAPNRQPLQNPSSILELQPSWNGRVMSRCSTHIGELWTLNIIWCLTWRVPSINKIQEETSKIYTNIGVGQESQWTCNTCLLEFIGCWDQIRTSAFLGTSLARKLTRIQTFASTKSQKKVVSSAFCTGFGGFNPKFHGFCTCWLSIPCLELLTFFCSNQNLRHGPERPLLVCFF